MEIFVAKILALFLLFFCSIVFSLIPLPFLNAVHHSRHWVHFTALWQCLFAGMGFGVLLMHLLPTARLQMVAAYPGLKFPLTDFLVGVGLLFAITLHDTYHEVKALKWLGGGGGDEGEGEEGGDEGAGIGETVNLHSTGEAYSKPMPKGFHMQSSRHSTPMHSQTDSSSSNASQNVSLDFSVTRAGNNQNWNYYPQPPRGFAFQPHARNLNNCSNASQLLLKSKKSLRHRSSSPKHVVINSKPIEYSDDVPSSTAEMPSSDVFHPAEPVSSAKESINSNDSLEGTSKHPNEALTLLDQQEQVSHSSVRNLTSEIRNSLPPSSPVDLGHKTSSCDHPKNNDFVGKHVTSAASSRHPVSPNLPPRAPLSAKLTPKITLAQSLVGTATSDFNATSSSDDTSFIHPDMGSGLPDISFCNNLVLDQDAIANIPFSTFNTSQNANQNAKITNTQLDVGQQELSLQRTTRTTRFLTENSSDDGELKVFDGNTNNNANGARSGASNDSDISDEYIRQRHETPDNTPKNVSRREQLRSRTIASDRKPASNKETRLRNDPGKFGRCGLGWSSGGGGSYPSVLFKIPLSVSSFYWYKMRRKNNVNNSAAAAGGGGADRNRNQSAGDDEGDEGEEDEGEGGDGAWGPVLADIIGLMLVSVAVGLTLGMVDCIDAVVAMTLFLLVRILLFAITFGLEFFERLQSLAAFIGVMFIYSMALPLGVGIGIGILTDGGGSSIAFWVYALVIGFVLWEVLGVLGEEALRLCGPFKLFSLCIGYLIMTILSYEFTVKS